MSIIDQLISKLAPHDCLGCGAEEGLLCDKCLRRLEPVCDQCYRCRGASTGSLTCAVCREASRLYRVRAATAYEGIAKDIIWKFKFTGAQAAAAFIAKSMAPLVEAKDPSIILVPIPTATSRVRQRGYDQSKLLARGLAQQTKLPYADCLMRSGQTHQRGSSREQRLAQLTTAFRVRRPRIIKNAHVILVDDVITTGATLEAAAMTLRAAGAKHVEGVVFARA